MSICSHEEIVDLVSNWRATGQSVGFTCGAFDLLHVGHVDYLQKARGLCDRLIVAVNSDRSIHLYKDPLRPINPEQQRVQVIASLSCVDAAILMDDIRPEALIRTLRPELYIKGGDYQVSQLRSAPLVESYGGRCVVIPVSHEVSTTEIIGRISELTRYSRPILSPLPEGKPIVFLDRDGTIIKHVPFINSAARVELLPGAGQGLRALQEQGFRLVVVTNQQGIGLGYFDYDAFISVNSKMLNLLAAYEVEISRFYFCPHSLSDHCACRKPGTKLVEDALTFFGAKSSDCFFIGDSESDMQCAERVGCTPIFLGQEGYSNRSLSAATFSGAVEHVIHSSSKLWMST